MIKVTNSIFVLGNGPSLRGFDFHALENHNSIGMNVAFRHWHRINWYPTYYMCMDTVMVETQKESIRDLILNYNDRIKLFFIRKKILDFYPEFQNQSQVLFLEDYINTPYFSGIKCTTGSFAPLFAAMLGYRKINLLGIDLNHIEMLPESKHVHGNILEITETPVHNPNYFFDDYQRKGELYNIPSGIPDLHYKSWVAVKDKLETFDINVVNCNPNSKLEIFDYTSIDKIIKRTIKNNYPDIIDQKGTYISMHLKSKKILQTNTNNKNIYIITTLDEVGVEEYLKMLRSLRKNSGQIKNLNIIALYGTLSLSSKKILKNKVDDIQCFSEFRSYKYLNKVYSKKLFHPLGKMAKLFFMREYLEHYAHAKDVSVFIDPDVIIQRPLQDFLSLVLENKVLFGHEVQLTHRAHLPNARLMRAELFDKPGSWQATYFTEINTGVNLSYAQSFCDLMFDFEKFVFNSEYFNKLDKIPDGNKWHDQDFFRYFYRKFIRLDIGIFDLEQVFTTTKGGAKCIRFDSSKDEYTTTWGKIPYLIHFAGGTIEKVPHINLKKVSTEAPKQAPSSEIELQTTAPRIIVEPDLLAFPMERHAVCLRPNTQHLVERWLRRVPSAGNVLLISNPACAGHAEKLAQQFPQISQCMCLPAEIETGQPSDALVSHITGTQGIDAVMIPMPIEQVELQFLTGNHIPKLNEHYGLIRALWRSGFRTFALNSYAGTKCLELPWLLDGFVNRHKGKRCFLVGNGPSLNMIDMSALKDEITFGSNRCYLGYEKWGFDFTYWGVMDRLQAEEYGPEYEVNIPDHTPKFFPFEYATMLEFQNACPVPFDFEWRPPYRFSGSADMLYLGYSVTHMMMQIAVIMGCNPIYLIGCDHRYNLKKGARGQQTAGTRSAQVWTAENAAKPTHFTAKYTDGKEQKKFITPKPARMDATLEAARKWCDAHDVQVLNATPNTGLKVFPLLDYSTLFPAKAKEETSEGPSTSLSPPKDYPKWANFARDTSAQMQQRIASAERGAPLTSNDGAIAVLKDIHKGKVGWLLGNGPSVRAEDLERLKGQVTFGCNRLYLAYDKMKFRPTYLCSTDPKMIEDFGQEMIDHHPRKVLFVQPERPDLNGDFVWFRWGSSTPLQFSANAYDFIMPGGGTLITALQIGFHMGITRFYIYGMDHNFTYKEDKGADHFHKASGDGNHFIQNYRDGKTWAPPVLWQVEGALQSAQVFLGQHGGWIRNATRGGKLDVLDRVNFDDVINPTKNNR